MADIDIEPVRAQLGRKVTEEDVATAAPLRCMAATFDRDEPLPVTGRAVPPGWHLVYFPDLTRRAGLGVDGLPLERGVLPQMPLPRRMYAGTTLTFHADIPAALIAAFAALLLTVFLGLAGTWRILGETPARHLRNL